MTTENKKSPTPEQASEAVPQRQRTENPTAEAIFEQASGGGNLICSKFEDGKSRADALTDDAARKIAHRIYCRLGLCGSNPLCFNGADATTQQRWISAIKDACPLFAASPVEQPAAAPIVELSGVRETLESGRGFWRTCSGCHESEDGHPVGEYPYSEILQCDLGSGCAECGGIGAIWDNTDYDDLVAFLDRQEETDESSQAATSANETGAEGATDLRERARLAADQWANAGTSIPQRTAYRDGFIDGASSPTIAAQAVAAWLHRDDPRDCISDAKKRDMIEHAGSGGRRLAENYSIGLCRLDALPAMAAAAPADERAAFDVALAALNDYQGKWDTGTPMPYAQSERIAMECACEAVRDALEEARAAASPAAEAVECRTCNDRGMIGGPSYYAPDEGGEPCPDCAAPQPAQADAPDAIPDECAASGASCSYAPEGRHGEMQCRYCGKAQADAPAEAREHARHEWDATGERCVKCGDKDWFADPHCSESRIKGGAPADAGEARKIHQVWIDETSSYADVTPEYYAERRPSSRRIVYTAPPTARVASLTDEQREAIKFAVTWFDQSVLPNTPYSGYSKALRALLNGADHDR
ncbi:hypothetical protein [Burkholderia ubonensis]|uniref:hypothetical protein n=1 Tax=Burkholderia ubonensis TaxID=101571 RepID=UPI00075F4FEF|nr:hypothetical protein [Burkholderia ubonensis]